ncbi:hypothetical protein GRJ2_000348800 [Grus japonensis]|uniref:Secreted protein n=1 Tax=Grus japonensis TaxID=30415 RepID=A0ABC9VZZ6_GRUJA
MDSLLVSSSLFLRGGGGGRGAFPGGDVRGGDRRNLTLTYLRSECLWILEQSCEFIWKKCCGCSQTLLQIDFNVSVLHRLVLSNRSSAVH